MRISDWSSDVCSSDLFELVEEGIVPLRARIAERLHQSGPTVSQTVARMERDGLLDRKSVVEGKSVSVRVDLGGRLHIKKKMTMMHHLLVTRASVMMRIVDVGASRSATLNNHQP